MKPSFLAGCLLLTFSLAGQKVIDRAIQAEGTILLTEGISVPKVDRGYTAWLPETGPVRGLILFTRSRSDTVNSEFLIDYALENGLGVLYATTDNRLEFFFETEKMREIEGYLWEVIETHDIPRSNLLFCGMSLEGTRALKLAAFAQSPESRRQLIPRAVALCDAPLDMARFHREMVRAKELQFEPLSANEGKWVSGYLEANLGGTPRDTLDAYIGYSPYCYLADGGEHLSGFKNIALRAYTEPDVNWWIENRGKGYYGMNAVDLAGLVNELRILGNEEAELIVTNDKGYRPDGSRHPHSWSIVDERELIDWFLALLGEAEAKE